ncbi:MAG: hypothetical protein E7616_02115 [Ruminococcaceae bacterium]|nr:hypothetical protein [Oscillospiraceae bacterium]
MNEDKKTYSIGPSALIFFGSAIGMLISFVIALSGKKKTFATLAFLLSFGGMLYGAMRQIGILKREEEELLTIELEEDEEENT